MDDDKKGTRAAEIERIADALTDEGKAYLQSVIYSLVMCFDPEEKDRQALVLFKHKSEDGVRKVAAINIDDMEISSLLFEMTDYFHMLNEEDAPPREMFN